MATFPQWAKNSRETACVGTSAQHASFYNSSITSWRYGAVVITAARLHSTKVRLKFCTDSNTARDHCDGVIHLVSLENFPKN